jgi:hypothetical protein
MSSTAPTTPLALLSSKEVLQAVAAQQSSTLGVPADDLLSQANMLGLAALKATGTIEHLSARIAERMLRDSVMRSVPDRQPMIAGTTASIDISLASPYPRELAVIRNLVAAGDIDGIVYKYPVRESSVLGGLAKGLRFVDRQDYEKAAITRIAAEKALQSKLKLRLGNLAAKLEEPN